MVCSGEHGSCSMEYVDEEMQIPDIKDVNISPYKGPVTHIKRPRK